MCDNQEVERGGLWMERADLLLSVLLLFLSSSGGGGTMRREGAVEGETMVR